MASNPYPAPASANTPPPVFNLPFGTLQPDGSVMLTATAVQFLQTLWTSIQGAGGINDTTTINVDSSGITQGLAISLIQQMGAAMSLMVPLHNGPTRQDVDGAILLAQKPVVPLPPQDAVLFANLPSPAYDGQRATITDGSVVAAGNFGTVAAGRSTNHVPVYYDAGSSAWRVG